jgi:hypothetical protein
VTSVVYRKSRILHASVGSREKRPEETLVYC